MSLEEFIKLIETKIAPFKLNKVGYSEYSLLYRKYPPEFLRTCVDIAVSKYLIYDENGRVTKESVDNFLDKIGGIAYNKAQSEIDQAIRYIQSQGKKVLCNWNESRANKVILDYIDVLENANYSEEMILVELKSKVTRLIRQSSSWSKWCDSMECKINDIKQRDKNNNIEIQQDGTILSTSIFENTPPCISNLCKQINASYENNLYDCTAVMMRRLLEVLLILLYKNIGLEAEIMDKSGKYYFTLDKIIKYTEKNQKIPLTLNAKKNMLIFKELGNYSAHNIWYNCTRNDIQPHILKYHIVIEELLYQSGIK